MGVFYYINIRMEKTIDIDRIASALSTRKKIIRPLRTKIESLDKILTQIESYRVPVKAVFFSKSIAFRVGSSSIKDLKAEGITGLPSGFKTEFKGNFLDEFLSLVYSPGIINKHKLVILSAGYYILFKRNDVITEQDKSIQAESAQILITSTALSELKRNGESITIKMGKETYEVDEFKKIPGTPKADAAFYYKNKPVIYLSLKKGVGPANFQQYGGWAGDLDIKTRSDVRSKPIFEDFVSRVENIFNNLGLVPDNNGRFNFNDLKKGSYFGNPLLNDYVGNKAKFGKDFSPSSSFGINNVHALVDGDIKFNFKNGVYALDGQYHFELNPNLEPSKTTFREENLYQPVLMVYKSEGQGLNQGGFSNARAAIWPNNRVAQTAIDKFNLAEQLIKNNKIDKLKETFLK